MNLYVLQPNDELVEENSSHYAKLVKTGLVKVIKKVSDFKMDGLLFRSTDELTQNTSLYFKAEHLTYQYLAQSTLPLFNHDWVVVDYQVEKDRMFLSDMFVKPNNKLKTFQPVILKRGEKLGNLGLSDEDSKDLEIVVSSVKDTSNVVEVRAVVIEQTLASFAVSSHDDKTIRLHSDVLKFILSAIKSYPNIQTYVLDIAIQNDSDFSIVEINPIETSGFFLKDYSRLLKTFSQGRKQEGVEET